MSFPFVGVRVIVVQSWEREPGFVWLGPPGRPPSKAQGRRGTRRRWKRQQRSGWRWGMRVCEPKGVLKSGDTIYCTARQYAAIKAATW